MPDVWHLVLIEALDLLQTVQVSLKVAQQLIALAGARLKLFIARRGRKAFLLGRGSFLACLLLGQPCLHLNLEHLGLTHNSLLVLVTQRVRLHQVDPCVLDSSFLGWITLLQQFLGRH